MNRGLSEFIDKGVEEGFGYLRCSFFSRFGEVFYTTLVCGQADGKAFDVDELRLRLDESNNVGWGWLELNVQSRTNKDDKKYQTSPNSSKIVLIDAD